MIASKKAEAERLKKLKASKNIVTKKRKVAKLTITKRIANILLNKPTKSGAKKNSNKKAITNKALKVSKGNIKGGHTNNKKTAHKTISKK